MRSGGPGRGPARPADGARSAPRSRPRSRQWRSIRTASVFSPRSTSQQSNGPGTAPSDFWRKASRSESASSFVATKPPTTSEWPPRYFVVECRTTSAPSASGCWRYGVANVLSTTTSAPTACAASAAARMSTRLSNGFVGVSSQTSFVRSSTCSARPVEISCGREKREAVALRLVHLREHAVDPAVDVVHRDDVVAGVEQVHERRRGAEPGGERVAVRRALERGEALLERGPRRVRDARVVVALVDADGLLHVGRRLVDRGRDRAGRVVRLLPDVDRARLELHGADATRAALDPLGAEEGGEARERLVERARCRPRRRAPRASSSSGRSAARCDPTISSPDEDRQDVVAVLPLRLRHVHLEAVVEVEERLGAVAVVDQAVEGGEEASRGRGRGRRPRPDAPPSPCA